MSTSHVSPLSSNFSRIMNTETHLRIFLYCCLTLMGACGGNAKFQPPYYSDLSHSNLGSQTTGENVDWDADALRISNRLENEILPLIGTSIDARPGVFAHDGGDHRRFVQALINLCRRYPNVISQQHSDLSVLEIQQTLMQLNPNGRGIEAEHKKAAALRFIHRISSGHATPNPHEGFMTFGSISNSNHVWVENGNPRNRRMFDVGLSDRQILSLIWHAMRDTTLGSQIEIEDRHWGLASSFALIQRDLNPRVNDRVIYDPAVGGPDQPSCNTGTWRIAVLDTLSGQHPDVPTESSSSAGLIRIPRVEVYPTIRRHHRILFRQLPQEQRNLLSSFEPQRVNNYLVSEAYTRYQRQLRTAVQQDIPQVDPALVDECTDGDTIYNLVQYEPA